MPTTLRQPPVGVSPAACLDAAQAHAQRLFGDAPVPVWTPPARRRPWAAGAAAALLAAGLWWWLGTGDAVVATPHRLVAAAPLPEQVVAATTAVLPAIIASTTIDAAVDHRQACAGAGCPSLPAPMVAVLDVSQSPADADAWALHPEPGPVTGVTGFRGHVNTPVVPDENDTTPGEETMPGVDQAPAGTE